jgi:hypothetical protein
MNAGAAKDIMVEKTPMLYKVLNSNVQGIKGE